METEPRIRATEPPQFTPRRITPRHVAYVVLVLTVSAVAFGPVLMEWVYRAWPERFQSKTYSLLGLWPGGLVVAFWTLVWRFGFDLHAMLRTFLWSLPVAVVLLLGPRVMSDRGPYRRMQCRNNLKQIGLALHNYHDEFGSFPPIYVTDENGKPAHSWRVLLLPYLDYAPVYRDYRFDEPWDSPDNREVTKERTLHQYICPSVWRDKEDLLMTSFLAVTGPGTMWARTDGGKLNDVGDGAGDTIMLIEAPQKKVYWNEPRDISMDEAIELLTSEPQTDDRGHYLSDHALFVDVSVRTTPFDLSPEDWRAMFTIDAGDNTPDVTLFGEHHEIDRYRRHRQAAYWSFWALAVLPLAWVRRRV